MINYYKSCEFLFENNDFVAINKHSGVVVIPDRWGEEPSCLKVIAENKLKQELFIVHRIDKNTSGIILFAKNKKAHTNLSSLFMNRQIYKEYLTIVDGFFGHEHLTANYPIREAKTGKCFVDDTGKPSLTEFYRLEKFRDYALIKAIIKTGRTHQIRVHLSFLGTPILCDHIYGHKNPLFLSSLKGRKYRSSHENEEKPLINRTALHANKIEFSWGNEQISIEAPIQKDFKATLNQLRKHNQPLF